MQGTPSEARQDTPDLLSMLSQRRTQAQRAGAPYLAPVAEQDTMLHWLAQTCREARKAADRKQVHVAAGADVDQSTVNRFESATAWPRNADRVVAAYADDLEIEPVQLWAEALANWQRAVASEQAEVAAAQQKVEQLMAEGPQRRAARRRPA